MSSKCLKTEIAELLALVNNIICSGAGFFINVKGSFNKLFCTSILVHVSTKIFNEVPVKKNASESEAVTINRGGAPALSLSRTHPSPLFIWVHVLYPIGYMLYCRLKHVRSAAAK